MSYRMTIDSCDYHIGNIINPHLTLDEVDKITDDEGFAIELNNVFLDGIHLKWGKYETEKTKSYSVSPAHDSIVSHFCLKGSCITEGNNKLDIQRGKSLLFKEEKNDYLYKMGVDNKHGSFFEVSINPLLFSELFMGEDALLEGVMDRKVLLGNLSSDTRFYSIIAEMYANKACYNGKLKKLYLESKVIELLLLQINNIEVDATRKRPKLQSRDIAAITYIKELLDRDLTHTSIPELALSVGINQTKLKSGFKELFGETIFAYLTTVRMQRAKELLMHTDLSITDIASAVGYKYVQHFSVSFQKIYNCLPSDLRH